MSAFFTSGFYGMERGSDEEDEERPVDDLIDFSMINQRRYTGLQPGWSRGNVRSVRGGAVSLPPQVDEYVKRHPLRTVGIVGAGAWAIGLVLGKLL